MALTPGRLNRRIELMRATVEVTRGEPIITGWSAVTKLWAEVIGQNGREAVIARVLEGISVYRITIRWRGDILPSDQIRLNGTLDLNIRSISDPDGTREQLMIIADTDGAQKTA